LHQTALNVDLLGFTSIKDFVFCCLFLLLKKFAERIEEFASINPVLMDDCITVFKSMKPSPLHHARVHIIKISAVHAFW
jgi:hypothetical protein